MKYNDVRNWILTECTSGDIEKIKRDLDARNDILVSEIQPGDKVSIVDISPKYLVGLTGKFHGREGGRRKARGSVTLDEASTSILRVKDRDGSYVAPDTKEYRLTGIPMVCFVKEE